MTTGGEVTVTPDEPESLPPPAQSRGLLGLIERVGNRLPEPSMIFLWLIAGLVVLSQLGASLGWKASLPYAGEEAPPFGDLEAGVLTFSAQSLLSEENLARLFTEMPKTLSSFAPLGIVLTLILGAAVAERSGLFSALIRGSLGRAPRYLLTPLVAIIGMVSHHASDAAYVVFIPLAAVLYGALGRHPIAGLAAAFAAVSGGFAGNITPGQTDVTLFAFTQEAARIIEPGWTLNPVGNWWFILAIVVVFTPIIWAITDLVIEPRLGAYAPSEEARAELEKASVEAGLSTEERRGLRNAGLAALAVVAGFAALALIPGHTPLVKEGLEGPARYQPLYAALVAGFFLLFLLTGVAYGRATGRISRAEDVMEMMRQGVAALAPYLVFVFFAAHFVAMFNWSRLGPILAIDGAAVLEKAGLAPPFLLVSILLLTGFLDLFIGSATAKWSALAPVVVPMFMLLGISPEMTTAAYRMGDSYTNIMTPLMSYFPLILGFARRWSPQMGVGSVLSLMFPYALSFMAAGIGMTVLWAVLDWPLGPGAGVFYERPA